MATVDTMGVRRKVSLDLMSDEAAIGDYVLIHIGFAMGKIDHEDALESLKVYEEMIIAMDEDERKALIDQDDHCSNRSL